MRIAIIGAGASGCMAAIYCARTNPSHEIVMFESNDKVGKKLLATGNGRCNITNQDDGLDNYYTRDKAFLSDLFRRFSFQDTIQFFEGLGVLTKSINGYYYPNSETAATIREALERELRELGIQIRYETIVTDIEAAKKGKFIIHFDNTSESFDRVIISVGGKASPRSGSNGAGYTFAKKLGHSLCPVVPGLCQMHCKESYFKKISGVRAKCQVSLYQNASLLSREAGELQFTEKGLSGIVIFQSSRIVNLLLRESKKLRYQVDLLPGFEIEELTSRIHRKLERYHRELTAEELFDGLVNKKLLLQVLENCNISPAMAASKMTEEQIISVITNLKVWSFIPIGYQQFDNAQVCAGGVPLEELTENLESSFVKDLYFAGELVDVDGKCGGYNLQWAWTSGAVAGAACGK